MTVTTAPPVWTVRAVLDAARSFLEDRGVTGARLDSELLLAHSLGLRRIDLYLQFDRPLLDDERAAYKTLLRRRGGREPLAYITGEREFYSLGFAVTPAVLIPRPETELLVELALERLSAHPDAVVLDLCTGSGCVAVALLHALPGLTAIATDCSLAALRVARDNAQRHGVSDRLSLVCCDLATALHQARVDAVVANPPYVSTAEMEQLTPEIAQHEPRGALHSADTGLEHTVRIARWLSQHLPDGGFAAIECASQRGAETRLKVSEAMGGDRSIITIKDLAGQDRAVLVEPLS